MHELSIAHEIHRTCRSAVAERGGGRLEAVMVAVGELTAVEPELLAYAWEATVAGGPDEGSRLEVEWRPAHQRCAECGEDQARTAGSWMRVCPQCARPLQVLGGDELDVLQVTFLQDDGGQGERG